MRKVDALNRLAAKLTAMDPADVVQALAGHPQAGPLTAIAGTYPDRPGAATARMEVGGYTLREAKDALRMLRVSRGVWLVETPLGQQRTMTTDEVLANRVGQ